MVSGISQACDCQHGVCHFFRQPNISIDSVNVSLRIGTFVLVRVTYSKCELFVCVCLCARACACMRVCLLCADKMCIMHY